MDVSYLKMADEIEIEFVRSEKIKTGCRIAVFKLRLDESLNDINGEIDYLFDGHKEHIRNWTALVCR